MLARGIADSVTSKRLADGVTLHRLVKLDAPWRASVLEIDRAACVSLRSIKGADIAVGRHTTSALLRAADASLRPIAAVNADFFSFAPPGVPVGAHVESGVLISGPVLRPVFAISADGSPFIGRISVSARVRSTRTALWATHWNRPGIAGVGIVDKHWGIVLDTIAARGGFLLIPLLDPISGPMSGSVALERSGGERYRAVVAPAAQRVAIAGDTLMLIGVHHDAGTAAPVVVGDTLRVERVFSPFTPRQVVGGFPELLRDSVVSMQVDSANDAAFRGLNPRTAVGYASRSRHILIAVIDGRQAGYSMGMSLRQTAELFRALGATHALNLDGGGSSAMVLTDPVAARRTRLVTRPSDSAGERPVANALAVLGTCK